MLGPDIRATQHLDCNAIIRRLALFAQFLALAGGQSGEEIIETGVAMISPMELDILPSQPACVFKIGDL